MAFDVSKRVIFVTGAASGIGAGIAEVFAGEGADVIAADLSAARLTEEVDRINGLGLRGTVYATQLDVTDAADFAAFADAAEQKFGRIDVLINNAGVMPLSPLAALKTDEWTRMIDVNIRGVLNGIAAVLPRFVAQHSGHVVNVASVGAHFVLPTAAVYCATKYAVWAITEGLRQEHDDIRATIISPGVTATELGDDISDPQIAAALKDWRRKSLTPDAIARAIRYALEQPEGVDINEVIVRPTAANM